MKKAIRKKQTPLTLDERGRLTGTGLENDHLRALSSPLVKAFREYCAEVAYGVRTETRDEHNEIVAWYLSLTSPVMLMSLDAETPIEHAIRNVPKKIKLYLGGNL